MPREIFEKVRAARIAALQTELATIPLDPAEPIVLEIGCGNGHFLTAYGTVHPDELCIGVDLRLERIDKALRKRRRANLDKVFFLRCEVRDFLCVLPAAIRLRDIYVLFPDPWPKKRHHKNRLLTAAFLDELAVRARPGARLVFRTDFQPYFDEVADTIVRHPRWRLQAPGAPLFEHPTVFQSRAPIFHTLSAEAVPEEAKAADRR